MDQQVNEFINKLELSFNSPELLKEALTHRSYVNENPNTPNGHNERLEFLGDAVLELATTQMLFNDYPNFPEGDLTSFRAALVRTESLAEEALKLELGKYLFMSNGEEATGGRDRQYILANSMEALIGSIYLDQGFDSALLFIKEKIYYKVQNIVDNRLDIDAKSKLQELSQEQLKITPTYTLISDEGPDHNKTFTMGVLIGETIFGKGNGESKQNAEQVAASDALENWQELVDKHFTTNNA